LTRPLLRPSTPRDASFGEHVERQRLHLKALHQSLTHATRASQRPEAIAQHRGDNRLRLKLISGRNAHGIVLPSALLPFWCNHATVLLTPSLHFLIFSLCFFFLMSFQRPRSKRSSHSSIFFRLEQRSRTSNVVSSLIRWPFVSLFLHCPITNPALVVPIVPGRICEHSKTPHFLLNCKLSSRNASKASIGLVGIYLPQQQLGRVVAAAKTANRHPAASRTMVLVLLVTSGVVCKWKCSLK